MFVFWVFAFCFAFLFGWLVFWSFLFGLGFFVFFLCVVCFWGFLGFFCGASKMFEAVPQNNLSVYFVTHAGIFLLLLPSHFTQRSNPGEHNLYKIPYCDIVL